MTKPFKLRLRLPYFQLCRNISSSVLANRSASTRTSSIPVKTEALDTSSSMYPMSPAPPPSSPDHSSSFKRNVASKIIPIGMDTGGHSSSCTAYDAYIDDMDSSPAYKHNSTFGKLYNSPANFEEFDASFWPVESSNAEKFHRKKSISSLKDQSATSLSMSVSSPAHSRWFSSEDEDEDDNESEGQLSSCSSLSSLSDFGHLVKNQVDHKCTNGNGRKIMKKESKVRKPKVMNASNSWKDGDKIKVSATAMMRRESDSSSGRKVLGRLLPCGVDGKVKESYAIMKKSADPFDDFKMSMLEMIREKQISEQEDLEKLLMCFLSLNAKDHHAVIVAAFTEVWEELYASR
ncbi:OLC1v1017953C1 [Oldenlandia corymbosa var. corymbosa]|uniref:Transcription repressor n=1 Tax=Oldenlandia corymbosa var. corymbosa TaxID=529605 RepID=A0AAV1EAJ1_OLDCO|nr:OLC1v1017953C1 [Oldenlandia corymbosa var. corymbosa]